MVAVGLGERKFEVVCVHSLKKAKSILVEFNVIHERSLAV